MSNKLIHETSPYLLQHANNPVDWYPWGEEAFQKAIKEDKPILLSIGYSTCHWCHVMERESFEDETVAQFMNKHFINIKLDREERPDIDQIYMSALQIISGNGGWPLNCFLTPDKKPFYAGTYYPPVPLYNRPSWSQVLERLNNAYKTQRNVVEQQADKLLSQINHANKALLNNAISVEEETISETYPAHIFNNLKEQFDNQYGGFGGAPKFPSPFAIQFLLEYHYYYQDEKALQHALFSLNKMIQGGIYDQLGGGFARYTTDRAWLVPHFEKMLYDNAYLIGLLADAYKITKNNTYYKVIEETLDFIEREMTSSEGAFFSALDADSEGEEGKYYVWTKQQVEQILDKDEKVFSTFFGIKKEGNWEGGNILWQPLSKEEFINKINISLQQLDAIIQQGQAKLLAERQKRVRPHLDNKILLSWNALMAKAYLKAYTAQGEKKYLTIAIKNVRFLLEAFKETADTIRLVHSYKKNNNKQEAFLDDYAYLVDVLIELYQNTFDIIYLETAQTYTDYIIRHFWDEEDQLFYYTTNKQVDLISRQKDIFDSATASGNAVMMKNLHQLSIFFDVNHYADKAKKMLQTLKYTIEKYPLSLSCWASGGLLQIKGFKEIAVIGAESNDVAKTINQKFIPNKLIMATVDENQNYPLTKGKKKEKNTLVHLCEQYICRAPVNIEDFIQSL